MDNNNKYDPEDIESLLMFKQFNELYEDEKSFVLQHVESEEEYESLRKTLYGLHDAARDSEWLEPEPSIKAALLKEFAQEKRGGFRIWLNSLFAFPEVSWYQRPAFRVALVSASIIGVTLFFVNRNSLSDLTAENQKSVENTTLTPSESAIESKNLFAENIPVKEFPPAPKMLDELTGGNNNNGYASASDSEIPSLTSHLREEMPVSEDQVNQISANSEADDVTIEKDRKFEIASAAKKPATTLYEPTEEREDKNLGDAATLDDNEKSKTLSDQIAVSSQNIKSVTVISDRENLTGGSITTMSVASEAGENDAFSWIPPPVSKSIPVSEMKDVLSILFTAH